MASARAGRPRDPGTDPFALADPWRSHVQRALQARARGRHAVEALPPGPLRDRLQTVLGSLSAIVDRVWAVARAADAATTGPASPARQGCRAATDADARLRRLTDGLTRTAEGVAELCVVAAGGDPAEAALSALGEEVDALRSALAEVERLDHPRTRGP